MNFEFTEEQLMIRDAARDYAQREAIKDVLESRSLKQYLSYVNSNIVISTVHGAKGLEWDWVILPDMEQYSFPNWDDLCKICQFNKNCKINLCYIKSNPNFRKNFFEALSVFYVAVTRAKKKVVFTCSHKRKNYKGEEKKTNISCFLKLPGLNIKFLRTHEISLLV
jgi:DNA helicase-2/ATP-dependent DNA helicase PcrA